MKYIELDKLLMYLADLTLAYSPVFPDGKGGDAKLYDFVRELSEEIVKWPTVEIQEDDLK